MRFFAPISLFFGFLVIYIVFHFIFCYHIEEIGYTGKHKARKLKKLKRKLGFWDRFFIITISQNVKKHEILAFFAFMGNLITLTLLPLFSLVMTVVVIIANSNGILFDISVKVPVIWLASCTVLMFITDLLFNPSERKRYGLSNRGKFF